MRLLILLFGLLFFSSCVTSEKCSALFPPKTIHTIEKETIKRDSIIPGGKVEVEVPFLVSEPGKIEKYYYSFKDTSGVAELRFHYNQELKRWIAECEAKDRKISWNEVKYLESILLDRNKEKKQKIPLWAWVLIGWIVFEFVSKFLIKIPFINRIFQTLKIMIWKS